jgi:hypothetical protein
LHVSYLLAELGEEGRGAEFAVDDAGEVDSVLEGGHDLVVDGACCGEASK